MRRLLMVALFSALTRVGSLVAVGTIVFAILLFALLIVRLLREQGPVELRFGPLVFVKGARARRETKRRSPEAR